MFFLENRINLFGFTALIHCLAYICFRPEDGDKNPQYGGTFTTIGHTITSWDPGNDANPHTSYVSSRPWRLVQTPG